MKCINSVLEQIIGLNVLIDYRTYRTSILMFDSVLKISRCLFLCIKIWDFPSLWIKSYKDLKAGCSLENRFQVGLHIGRFGPVLPFSVAQTVIFGFTYYGPAKLINILKPTVRAEFGFGPYSADSGWADCLKYSTVFHIPNITIITNSSSWSYFYCYWIRFSNQILTSWSYF